VKPTQVLMHEHRVIEHVLSALQFAADRLSRGDMIRPAFFINAALFIKNFVDGCHHRKEESVLFVAMNESDITSQGEPIAVMLAAYEQGRAFTREMKDAAEKWEKGDLSARPAVIQDALGIVALLRQHIHKEDTILFPMADRMIKPDLQARVVAEFERIEVEEMGAGIHEKYHTLAEVLEKESQAPI
jgi:hemerythrin-like domain-containing protein